MSVAMRRRMSPLTFRSSWSCSCPVCWKQAVFVSAWLAGPCQLPARRLDRRPRHCTAQYGTIRHETPCDRRHTDVLTKVLTTRLGKPSVSRQTRRSPAVQHWGERRDSNPRHPGPQPGALPTELRPPSSPALRPGDSRPRAAREDIARLKTSIAVPASPRLTCAPGPLRVTCPGWPPGPVRRTAPRSRARWRNPVPAAVRTAPPGSTGVPARSP